MLELLCGAPGSGKTEELIARAKKALDASPDAKILFIVPEQETVSAENRIFSSLPPHAPLTVEVDNFSRLADSVFRKVGGVAREHVGRNAKKLCMWRTLKLFPKQGNSFEGVGSALSLVNELTSGGATPEKLAAAAENLASEARLSEKLKEYALISSVYSAFIDEIGYDAHRDGEMLCEALVKNPSLFADTDICIDGFTSFTGIEYEIISHLSDMAKSVTVTVSGDPDSNAIWLAEIRECAATLTLSEEKNGRKPIITKLGKNKRTERADIVRLASELWAQGTEKYTEKPDNISLFKCRTPIDEAELVACDIARQVQNGARYSDITVTVRSADKWQGVLDTVLEEHGIPSFFAAGEQLDEHYAVCFILRAAAAVGFDRESIAAMLKTGCTSLSDDDCDIYIKYAKTWKISKKDYMDDADWDMEPDGFVMHGSGGSKRRSAYTLEAVNRVRRRVRELLYPLYEMLDSGCTVKDACAEIFRLCGRAGLNDILKKHSKAAHASGNDEEADKTARVWNAILAALDTAVIASGDEPVNADELAVVMRLIFSDTPLSVIPTSADAVTVGAADTLRSSGSKHVYILGVCEGEFPASVSSKSFLSGREKALLENEGIRLTKDANTLASRELFIFRRVVSYARESVTVTYHERDLSGETCAPSSAFKNTVLLFPAFKDNVPSGTDELKLATSVWSKKSAEAVLKRTDDRELKEAVHKALVTSPYEAYDPKFTLDAKTRDMLFGETVDLTQSRLEYYAKCRFMYFCRYMLGLNTDALAEFDYSSNGTYIHAMLERLVPLMSEKALTADELNATIDKFSEEYYTELIPERNRTDPRLNAQFERMKNAVRPIAASLDGELKNSEFKPIGAEIAISTTADDLPRPIELPLEEGRSLRLFGTVDRADSFTNDDGTYVRVIDYKTNDKSFRLKNVDEGVNLQLLIYLLTLCKDKRKEFLNSVGCKGDALIPAGMLYCVTKPPEKQVNTPPSAEEYGEMVNGAAAPRGIIINDKAVIAAHAESQMEGFAPIEGEKDSDRMLFTAKEFASLGEKTEKKLISMASSLARGEISPRSELGESTACQYCDFINVCGNTKKGGRH